MSLGCKCVPCEKLANPEIYVLYQLSYRMANLPNWTRTSDHVLKREVTDFYTTHGTHLPRKQAGAVFFYRGSNRALRQGHDLFSAFCAHCNAEYPITHAGLIGISG